MSSVGRVSSEDEALVKKEKKEDDAKIFWQEINVDGLRYAAPKMTPHVPFCSHAPLCSRLQLQRLACHPRYATQT